MNIGLYFGSFNPIHVGHLIIANFVLENTDLDKVWFVVSPHNPLKASSSLLNEYDRLHLVELAIADNNNFRASNIEFTLPRPSFTIDTLAYLSEKFPLENFSIIMGSDSYSNLPKWKNFKKIIDSFPIYIFIRPGHPVINIDAELPPKILEAPLLEISATLIREQIKAKKSIQYLVPDAIRLYILENNYYQ